MDANDKTATHALELLTSQHDEVDELFAMIEKARDGARKRAYFEELADKLAAHAKIEEVHFYPAVNARATRDLVMESVEEHLAMKRTLADLLELDVEDEHFDAKLSVLKEQVEHHAREEEEGKLFPEVRKLLDMDQLAALGGEMLALFEELLDDAPRNQVPDETVEAAPV
jgi:hemerythrin superfamily protein